MGTISSNLMFIFSNLKHFVDNSAFVLITVVLPLIQVMFADITVFNDSRMLTMRMTVSDISGAVDESECCFCICDYFDDCDDIGIHK